MRAGLTMFVTGLALLVTSDLAVAHHSFSAEFDATKAVKVTGTVTKVEWTNPHAWFFIDVKDESGAVANWGMELGPPSSLMRAGWSRNSMKVGDVVTVEGSRAKDASNHASVKAVTLSSTGQRLFGGSSLPTNGTGQPGTEAK
jgi:hypothetical protein